MRLISWIHPRGSETIHIVNMENLHTESSLRLNEKFEAA
jgi:hypothetical protein